MGEGGNGHGEGENGHAEEEGGSGTECLFGFSVKEGGEVGGKGKEGEGRVDGGGARACVMVDASLVVEGEGAHACVEEGCQGEGRACGLQMEEAWGEERGQLEEGEEDCDAGCLSSGEAGWAVQPCAECLRWRWRTPAL